MAKDKGLTAKYEGPRVSAGEVEDTRKVGAGDVPDGSVLEVEQWVGDDKAKAAAALKVEQGKQGHGRVTLIDALERVVNG